MTTTYLDRLYALMNAFKMQLDVMHRVLHQNIIASSHDHIRFSTSHEVQDTLPVLVYEVVARFEASAPGPESVETPKPITVGSTILHSPGMPGILVRAGDAEVFEVRRAEPGGRAAFAEDLFHPDMNATGLRPIVSRLLNRLDMPDNSHMQVKVGPGDLFGTPRYAIFDTDGKIRRVLSEQQLAEERVLAAHNPYERR